MAGCRSMALSSHALHWWLDKAFEGWGSLSLSPKFQHIGRLYLKSPISHPLPWQNVKHPIERCDFEGVQKKRTFNTLCGCVKGFDWKLKKWGPTLFQVFRNLLMVVTISYFLEMVGSHPENISIFCSM
jgi:hypothetical protein